MNALFNICLQTSVYLINTTFIIENKKNHVDPHHAAYEYVK